MEEHKSFAKLFLDIGINKNDRVKTSLTLCNSHYKKFKDICKERGVSAADMLDFLIIDFNEYAKRHPVKKEKL